MSRSVGACQMCFISSIAQTQVFTKHLLGQFASYIGNAKKENAAES